MFLPFLLFCLLFVWLKNASRGQTQKRSRVTSGGEWRVGTWCQRDPGNPELHCIKKAKLACLIFEIKSLRFLRASRDEAEKATSAGAADGVLRGEPDYKKASETHHLLRKTDISQKKYCKNIFIKTILQYGHDCSQLF